MSSTIPYDFSKNYIYTGATDIWTKDRGITSAYFIVTGGGGGGSNVAAGGNGAYVYSFVKNFTRDISFDVIINVGGGGKSQPTRLGGISLGGQTDASGISYSNGGDGTSRLTTSTTTVYSGGGGGASNVFYMDPTGTIPVMIIAGGGGGGGTNTGGIGGAGGGIGVRFSPTSSIYTSSGFNGLGIGGGEAGNTLYTGEAGLGGLTGGVNGYNFEFDVCGNDFFKGGGGGNGGSFTGGAGGAGYGGAAGGKGGGGGGGGSYSNGNVSIFSFTGGGQGGALGQDGSGGTITILWNKVPNYPPAIVPQFMLNAQHIARSVYTAPRYYPVSVETYPIPRTSPFVVPQNIYSCSIGNDQELYTITWNGANSGVLYAFSHDFSFRWKLSLDLFGTPTIVPDGTIYASSSNNGLNAIADNTSNGSIIWKFPVSGKISTSPTIDLSGIIYVGTNTSKIYAVKNNGSNATQYWMFDDVRLNQGTLSYQMNGTLTFNAAYTKLAYTNFTYDPIPFPGISVPSSKLVVLNVPGPNEVNPVPAQLWANPIIAGNRYYGFYNNPSIGYVNSEEIVFVSSNGGYVHAYRMTDGSSLWASECGPFGQYISDIAIGADNLIYFTAEISSKVKFFVVDSSNDGQLLWQFSLSSLIGAKQGHPFVPSPMIDASNNVLTGGGKYLYSLNGAQKRFNWRYNLLGNIQSTPVIGNNNNIYFTTDTHLYDISGSITPYLSQPLVQMYMLNPQHTGVSTYAGPLTKPTQVKTLDFVSGNLFVSPSIAIGSDGVLYLGANDGDVYAVNSATFTLKWKKNISNIASPANANALYTTPVIGLDGTIYIGSNHGYLFALDSSGGTVKWSYAAGAPLQSSPIIDENGILYFGAGTKVFALGDALTEAYTQWNEPYDTGSIVNSSPALNSANGYLYVGSDNGNVYALHRDTGEEMWVQSSLNLPLAPIYTSATVDGSNNVIIGNGSYMDGTLYYLDGGTGSIIWDQSYNSPSPNIGPFYNTPAVYKDTIFLSTIPYVYAIDRLTGVINYYYGTENCYYTSPTIDASGYLYVASLRVRDDEVYGTGFKENDGILTCLDSTDLSLIWEMKVATNGRLAPPVLSNNHTIYTSATANKIYAIS